MLMIKLEHMFSRLVLDAKNKQVAILLTISIVIAGAIFLSCQSRKSQGDSVTKQWSNAQQVTLENGTRVVEFTCIEVPPRVAGPVAT